MIRIAITDDHPMIIKGIKNMLSNYDYIQIDGEYNTGEELLEGLQHSIPDILLLDIQMPGATGDELARILNKSYPDIKIIALTGFDTPFYIRSMMQNGCMGYLLKNTAQNDLILAIQAVFNGEQYIDESIKKILLSNLFNTKKEKSLSTPELTRREKEVLKLIVDELTSQEIADHFILSSRTVEKYRLQLLQKLKVKNTAGLVKIAIELNLTEETNLKN